MTSDGYLESELLRNPYHDFNTYGYNSSTGITPYDEVDYEEIKFTLKNMQTGLQRFICAAILFFMPKYLFMSQIGE